MKRISSLFPFIIALVVFRNWFMAPQIVGGDWPYFFNETIRGFIFPPPSWSALHGNGLGGIIPGYFLDQYLYLTTSLSVALQIPWVIIYKIFWFGFFIVLSILSSMYLTRTVLLQTKIWQVMIAAIIYAANTYILMVVGGGQMGVALAYSIAPLVLVRFIKLIDHFGGSSLRPALVAGIVLAVQIMVDPRIAYITMIAVTLYYTFGLRQTISFKNMTTSILVVWFVFVLPGVIALLLNASWMLPLLFSHFNPLQALGSNYTSGGIFQFLSFASFPQSLSLLHPNWPENIFGKTYFMRWEFLILPIIAYGALLFTRHNTNILYFASLGLLGSFLAKGANLPLGEINIWALEHIPGFVIFRDPTKFYLLVALSYTVLIPYSLSKSAMWMKDKFKIKSLKTRFGIQNLFLFLIFSYLLFLIRPAILGQLGGTFKQHEIPKEYILLKDFLHNQPNFFRTLWIPRQQRFTFVSNIHPSVEAMPLFQATSSAEIISLLKTEESQKYLRELSIKYIVVPYDSLGEIFLEDRKYNDKLHQDVLRQLGGINWLKRLNDFGRIGVFEVPQPKDHFYLEGDGVIFSKMLNPTSYKLSVSTTHPTYLIFSENYSPYWLAKIDDAVINAERTSKGLNSFRLNKVGKYTVDIYYSQQKYYNYGRILSAATLLASILLLVILKS